MARHQQWHISGWPAFLIAPIAIPSILVILVCQKLFGLKSTADLTAADVASYLEDHVNDKGGEWDWDDFTSIAITDPLLESVRKEAAYLACPLDDDGRNRLRELLLQVKGSTALNVR